MNSPHHKDDIFIAEYTLGLLDPDQIAQAHALLGRDDEAVVSALQWEARLLELTDALTPLTPPAGLLARIQTTLGLPRNALPGIVSGSPAATVDTQAPARPAPPAPNPFPVAPAASGATLEFEPRLIRPDSASISAQARPAAQAAPAKTQASFTASEPPPPPKQPSDAPAQEPTRVRAAPPDPMEAIRREAAAHKPAKKGVWRSLWFWRCMTAALAILATVLVLLPKQTFRQDPALRASLQPPAAPTPKVMQVAIMQAPGTSSTPGWILTVDSRQVVVLTPQVEIVVPQSESVYLWTYNEQQSRPRLLGAVDPSRALTLPMEVTGEIGPGQIFEMTQEPNIAPPQQPEGPILFIGRTVNLG